ncbi:MAG: hypothetical protein IAE82_11985 [Opitutaceae bacterium]|nr:hypothetical protein [Opitutaceae bacterium]
MKITRIQADADGVTHFEDREIPLEPAGTIGRLSGRHPAGALIFRETSGDYDFDWHPAPQKQWVVLLDGEIEIETGDGAVRRFVGGDVLQLEDTDGRGHRTRQINAGTRRSLFIPFA